MKRKEENGGGKEVSSVFRIRFFLRYTKRKNRRKMTKKRIGREEEKIRIWKE